MSLRIDDAYPASARTLPGQPVTLLLELSLEGGPRAATLSGQLRDLGVAVAEERLAVELRPGAQRLALTLPTPAQNARGYEALLRLELDGAAFDAATAVLVADHWRHAPRYGFLSEFPPGDASLWRVSELAKHHLTVVQFYDWMYRHYRFLPPEDEFGDAMGRRLSLATVRERVAACQRAGMAALAYGAVYGAEPEFASERPDWLLRDAEGQPLSLIELFYITDLRAGAPWRERILAEFEAAVREVGFDGIHMDQYGFPKRSYDAQGKAVDLAEEFPGLIDEAARRVAAQRSGAAVLFNAVNNWPLEQVAAAEQAAVYIEVWPPHDDYRDLCDLIRRARDLSGKQAVLAAYLEPFREGGEGAEQAALLATAVIASAGGFHLLLGEGDGVLRDPYYPNHGRLRPAFARRMRRYYDHTAAHHHYLFDPSLREETTSFVTGINSELSLLGAPSSARPECGAVWVGVRQRDGQLVVNLVNLVGLRDPRWNAAKEAPAAQAGLALRLSRHFKLGRAVWASPDGDGAARELAWSGEEGGSVVPLPELALWGTLVLELV